MYRLSYEPGWEKHLVDFSPDIQLRIGKRIKKLKFLTKARHLKFGLPYFVVEVDQYRIAFSQYENVRKIVFVGNHKQYEEWYSSLD